MMEAFMFDEEVHSICWDHVLAAVKAIMAAIKAKCPDVDLSLREILAIASWMTGYEDSDMNILATKPCIYNTIFGHLINNLPFAVYPNAKTAAEAFSTDYSLKQIAKAIALVCQRIKTCIKNGQILFLDANEDPLFPNDELSKILVKEFGFQLLLRIFGDELRLHFHPTKFALVFLHKPLSVAGDSWLIQLMTVILRNLTSAVIHLVVCRIKGLSDPEKDAIWQNFLHAAFELEVTRVGFHLGKCLASCLHRNRITAENVDALARCQLACSTSMHVAQNLRRAANAKPTPGGYKREGVARPVDSNVILKAHNILSYVKTPTDFDTLAARVHEMFGDGHSKRWGHLKELFSSAGTPECLAFLKDLEAAHQGLLKGKGNKTKRRSVSKEEQEANALEFTQKLHKLLALPVYKRKIWIRVKAAKTEEEQKKIPKFAKNQIVLKGLAYAGVVQRLQKLRGQLDQKGTTAASDDKDLDLDDILPESHKGMDLSITKTNGLKETFVLYAIGIKKRVVFHN